MPDQYTDALPEAEKLQHAADVLKTVAHPTRLKIIGLLEAGERSVTEIRNCLGAPQPYVSQHLSIMKTKGILGSRRNGTQIYYSIANLNVVKIIHCVRQHGGADAQTVASCATDDVT